MSRDRGTSMRRRLMAATGGASLGAGVLAAVLVVCPWRPSGLLVGILVLGVLAPAAGGAGALVGARIAGETALGPLGRVAALGAPPCIVLVLLAINSALSTTGPGGQQVAALVAGCGMAAWLAGRFTGPLADDVARVDPTN